MMIRIVASHFVAGIVRGGLCERKRWTVEVME